jgi:2-polyprenyl-3-methyl-5-hydroxy-6-metoxy-1,4-benzoquinol methylase
VLEDRARYSAKVTELRTELVRVEQQLGEAQERIAAQDKRLERLRLLELELNWDAFGKTDPLWAVLTEPDKRLNNWDQAEFFETGRSEIDTVLGYATDTARQAGPALRLGRALDFGCAVGRLTQALADHFQRVDGVDIAPSMIEQAREWNRHGERCTYHVNVAEDLRLFANDSFDFIYTAHVMQHMDKRFQQQYVAEFVRVLAPGGYALVEMVSEQVSGADAPLPAAAYRAVVTPRDALRSVASGTSILFPVIVRNDSSQVLPSAGTDGWFMVSAGARWVDGAGAVTGEAHGFLPADLPPGETAEVTVYLTAPKDPGAYSLELDCVQEGVAWFGDRGSTITRLPVQVEEAAGDASAADAAPGEEPEPRMEMNGVPEEEATAWIASAGGQLAGRVDWSALTDFHMHDWQRVGYLITKS